MLLTQLFSSISSLWKKYKQLVLSLVALAATLAVIRVILAVVDALNDIPLLAATFHSNFQLDGT